MIGYDFNPTGTNIAHMPWAHSDDMDEEFHVVKRTAAVREKWRPKYLDKVIQIVRENLGMTYTQVARKAWLSNNAGVLCQLAEWNMVYMDEHDGLHLLEDAR